jgi:hypothetical protein
MRVLCALVVVVSLSVPILAHHGNASFDTSKEVTLKGTVTEYIWANPHCFLKFDAKDDTGTVRNWAVEVSNPTDMTKRGWARSSFKVGDVVTVNGDGMDKTSVDILYLTDGKTDIKVEVTEQSAKLIKFKVPESAKSHRWAVMVHTTKDQLIEEPVRVTIE